MSYTNDGRTSKSLSQILLESSDHEFKKTDEEFEKEKNKMIKEYQMGLQIRWFTSLSKRDLETKTWSTLDMNSQELCDCAKALKAWDPDVGVGIFLHGSPGNGKTHMIKALIQDHYSSTHTFKFVRSSDLYERLKNFEERDSVFEDLIKPWALVIDDFGTERATEWEQEQLFQILEHRKEQGKIIFMTSNLDVAQIDQKYNKRLVSRFGEHMLFIENKAPSYRRVIHMRNKKKMQEALTLVE